MGHVILNLLKSESLALLYKGTSYLLSDTNGKYTCGSFIVFLWKFAVFAATAE